MNLGLRLVVAIAFLGLLGLTGVWLFGGQPRSDSPVETGNGGGIDPDPRFRWQSSEQCKTCHEDVWDEWYGSHHQIAYLNPEVRRLSEDFRNKECQACHLPQQIAITGFGQRALPRLTRPDQGVDCITCHVGANGEVFGARAVPSAPCKPIADERFTSMSLCESCHNQHTTTDQWRASEWPGKGIDCNDCHMPEVERKATAGSVRTGRSHEYRGAHDVETLRKAGTLEASVDGGELVMALVNTGAGHNFPTEERHRAVDIVYAFVDGDGNLGEWTRAWRFRQPYRDEAGDDTQLPSGARKAVRVAIPGSAVRAKVRLWYRLQPFIGDDDPASTLLEEREVELR